MTKLEIDRHEINNAINAIQEFIRLIVNGIEVVRDDRGICAVRIINHETKEVIREFEPEELITVADNCNALMILTQRSL
jgi:uncharacterized FlaG/YvyC family protein